MMRAQLASLVADHEGAPGDWNDFVARCDPSHFEQTSWWADVEAEDGWSARYLVIRDMGRIVAGVMVLVRQQRGVGRVGYVFRGPLIANEEAHSEQVPEHLVTSLKGFARKQGLALLVVVPPYDGAAVASALLNAGFLRHPEALPPSSLSPGTITVDLRRDVSQIERGYRRTLRQEISRARKEGVVVSLGTADDLGTFWERHLQLCRRRRVATNVPSLAYVRRVWHEFNRQDRAWLFEARLGGEVLCSLICLGVGRWFYAWRIGWAPDSVDAHPTQAVFAHAIRTAKEAGFHFFDFMEIHPDDVARILRGEPVRTPTAGMTFFKLGFGGSVRTFPPALDWYPNPAVRLFMRVAGARLAASGPFLKVVHQFTRSPRPDGA